MFSRILNLSELLKKKSFSLFGCGIPRRMRPLKWTREKLGSKAFGDTFSDPFQPHRYQANPIDETTLFEFVIDCGEAPHHLLSTVFVVDMGTFEPVDFVEGRRAIEKLLYSAIHDWRRSYEQSGDWTMWGYQDHTIVEEYRAWHDYAWKIRNPKERIALFSSLSGVGQQTRDKITRREIRLLPGGHEFPCSIWVHADHVFFAVTSSKPHFAILLVDKIISQTLRTLFQLLWEQTEDSQKTKGVRRRVQR